MILELIDGVGRSTCSGWFSQAGRDARKLESKLLRVSFLMEMPHALCVTDIAAILVAYL